MESVEAPTEPAMAWLTVEEGADIVRKVLEDKGGEVGVAYLNDLMIGRVKDSVIFVEDIIDFLVECGEIEDKTMTIKAIK